MRQILFAFVLAIFLASVAATTARAGRPFSGEMKSARTEVAAVITPADVRPAARADEARGVNDLRDSAALVLVGTMLIGLAAAVRRTV